MVALCSISCICIRTVLQVPFYAIFILSNYVSYVVFVLATLKFIYFFAIGSIPTELGDNTVLSDLRLNGNSLTGAILCYIYTIYVCTASKSS